MLDPSSFSILLGLKSLLANDTEAFLVGVFLGENEVLFNQCGILIIFSDCLPYCAITIIKNDNFLCNPQKQIAKNG